MNNKIVIRCPKCGAEYLACEIFYPNDILGKPSILKDEKGKILYVENNHNNGHIEEDWECEYCNSNFKASLDYATGVVYNKDIDFSEDFSLSLNQDKENILE